MPSRTVAFLDEVPPPLREGLRQLRDELGVPDDFPVEVIEAAQAAAADVQLPVTDLTDVEFGTIGEQRAGVCDVRAVGVRLDRLARPSFSLVTPDGAVDVQLPLSGLHMVANACAAAAIGFALDVALDVVATGLESATLSPWRMEITEAPSGAIVINDTYNANPESMRAALDALVAVPADRRIAVLGVMAEIDDPELEHRGVAAYAAERNIHVIAVGTRLYGVEPIREADDLGLSVAGGDAILVKGSRVAGLERLAARLLSGG